jgi:hypothetical protein
MTTSSKTNVVLNLEKFFTKGNLVGLTYSEKMSFVSVERAKVWLKGVASNAYNLDYMISSYSIEEKAAK